MRAAGIATIGFLLVLASAPAALAEDSASAVCYEKAITQMEIHQCAATEAAASEEDLSRIYQAVREKYADDPVFLKHLQAAQQAWLKYRDEELLAKYPHAADDPRHHYGSAFPTCLAGEHAQLTRERIAQLRQWLDGLDETEVCRGSVR